MEERDDWLEGVRRWYFGGDAPADVTPDELIWPGAEKDPGCDGCAPNLPIAAAQVLSASTAEAAPHWR